MVRPLCPRGLLSSLRPSPRPTPRAASVAEAQRRSRVRAGAAPQDLFPRAGWAISLRTRVDHASEWTRPAPSGASFVTDRVRQIIREHGRLAVDVDALGDEADLYEAGMTSHA